MLADQAMAPVSARSAINFPAAANRKTYPFAYTGLPTTLLSPSKTHAMRELLTSSACTAGPGDG